MYLSRLQTLFSAAGGEPFWLTVGFAAQAGFFMRFVVQWIASERAGRSIVPVAFWYFSLGGAVGLLAYAIHRRDPVFILGQSGGFLVYLRNLHLIRRERRRAAADNLKESRR
jgi:lipid-A-disaccharide synthase-like uncharacterized protein